MADRYWVGGTANWDNTAGTKWSATSGGPGGASVPTNADDVFFDANSGAVTVTISITNAVSKNLTCTGFTGTLSLPSGSGLSIWGNLLFSAGMTFSQPGRLAFSGTLTNTITTNGKSFGSGITHIGDDASSTGSWTLQDSLTTTGSLNFSRGTFNSNNYNIVASALTRAQLV